MRSLETLALAAMAVASSWIIPVGVSVAQDSEAGAQVFMRCAACHQVGASAQHSVGPQLSGVLSRSIASAPGYDYSTGLSSRAGQAWNDAALAAYIADPTAFIGERSAMPAQRLRPNQVANLIAFLRTQ
ncbi:MAG: cytochrome c family protein [Devosiaceae bacterium]